MRTCPSCGFHNPESRDRCFRCQAALAAAPVKVDPTLADRGPDRVGEALASVKRGTWRLRQMIDTLDAVPPSAPYRHPAGAALLSVLLPGAGQWRNHQPRKAAIAFGAAALMALWVVRTFYEPYNHWVMVGYLLVALLAAADAHHAALRINGRFTLPRHRWAYWFAFIAMAGMLLGTMQLWGYPLGIHLVTVWGDDLAPGFRSGDKVLVWRWTGTLGGLPRAGQVLYIAPDSFRIIRPGGDVRSETMYVIRPLRTFGVVTGEGGDHLRAEGPNAPLLVNGSPAPPSRWPVNPGGELRSLDLRVPPNMVAVLPSSPTVDAVTDVLIGESAPSPAEARARGWRVEGYEQAALLDRRRIHGRALFRYHPPPRRQWFGSGGLWSNPRLPPVFRYPEGS